MHLIPTRAIEVLLAAPVTTQELDWTASYLTIGSSFQITGIGASDGLTSGVTPIPVVTAPAANTTRKVLFISVTNRDSVPATVTIALNAGGTRRVIWRGALNPGDSWLYDI